MTDMKKTVFILMAICLLASCKAQQTVLYFQDTEDGTVNRVSDNVGIHIRPDDKLSIIVNSKDYQLMNLFNLAYSSHRIGQMTTTGISTSNGETLGYKVDKEGYIDFPVLGRIKVEGMTREEIANYIKNELISSNLVKDAVVTVDYLNLTISVMGEVSHPGRYGIDRDRYTILDAISSAGDLTIFGMRDRVKVMRTTEVGKKTYVVNLMDAKSLMESPVYYLQQNDVIYVEPNKMKARQSTVNGNNILSASFWISVASLLSSIITIFIIRR